MFRTAAGQRARAASGRQPGGQPGRVAVARDHRADPRMAELRRTAGGVPVRLSLDELQGSYGSDSADQALVADVLTGLGLGLEVTSSDPGSRRLTVAGPVSALARAFGTTLSLVTSEGHGQAGPGTHPCGADGTGQAIAIIEFGGGFAESDLNTYFSGLGITTPSVTAVGVDGASNMAGQDPTGADGKVLLDIEVAGSVAPGAAQVVYFSPNTDHGFVDAVTEAIHATPMARRWA